MDERSLRRSDGFDAVKRGIDGLIGLLTAQALEVMRRR